MSTKAINQTKQTNQNEQQTTLQFLALFNEIDKYFDRLVNQEKFIPYNEKIKFIKDSSHSISHYIRQNEYLLKFFGEIRNHITHGIKLKGHSFTTPSTYAINKITQCRNIILKPPTAKNFFSKKVMIAQADQLCKNIFPQILTYSHLPIIKDNTIVAILNQ